MENFISKVLMTKFTCLIFLGTAGQIISTEVFSDEDMYKNSEVSDKKNIIITIEIVEFLWEYFF